MVAQYDLEGNLIDTFDTMQEASKATGVGYRLIANVIYDVNRTAGGFIWRKFSRLKDLEEKIKVIKGRTDTIYSRRNLENLIKQLWEKIIMKEKEWSIETLTEFKKEFRRAKKENEKEFEFEGKIYEIVLAYYLIDYLESIKIKK